MLKKIAAVLLFLNAFLQVNTKTVYTTEELELTKNEAASIFGNIGFQTPENKNAVITLTGYLSLLLALEGSKLLKSFVQSFILLAKAIVDCEKYPRATQIEYLEAILEISNATFEEFKSLASSQAEKNFFFWLEQLVAILPDTHYQLNRNTKLEDNSKEENYDIIETANAQLKQEKVSDEPKLISLDTTLVKFDPITLMIGAAGKGLDIIRRSFTTTAQVASVVYVVAKIKSLFEWFTVGPAKKRRKNAEKLFKIHEKELNKLQEEMKKLTDKTREELEKTRAAIDKQIKK